MTPFQPGVRRRLRDAQRFDDSLGNGFAYAVHATHGPIAPDVWVHGCWIVDEEGRRHPGLVTPVPIRLRDLLDPN